MSLASELLLERSTNRPNVLGLNGSATADQIKKQQIAANTPMYTLRPTVLVLPLLFLCCLAVFSDSESSLLLSDVFVSESYLFLELLDSFIFLLDLSSSVSRIVLFLGFLCSVENGSL